MTFQPPVHSEDRMVDTLERVAKDLERVIIGIYACAGLLGCMLFVLVLRLSIGR